MFRVSVVEQGHEKVGKDLVSGGSRDMSGTVSSHVEARLSLVPGKRNFDNSTLYDALRKASREKGLNQPTLLPPGSSSRLVIAEFSDGDEERVMQVLESAIIKNKLGSKRFKFW